MDVELFTAAAGAFRAVLVDEAVSEQWEAASVLSGYSVGGLVAHVCAATGWLETALQAPEPDGLPVLSLGEWFADMLPRQAGDEPSGVHEWVRADAQRRAKRGPQALTATYDRVISAAVDLLEPADSRRMLTLQPVRPQAMALPDFVRTRLLELVVHTDDLVVSVGHSGQAVPAAPLDDCLQLLFGIARFRHGDAGVLRALTRAERAPARVFPVI